MPTSRRSATPPQAQMVKTRSQMSAEIDSGWESAIFHRQTMFPAYAKPCKLPPPSFQMERAWEELGEELKNQRVSFDDHPAKLDRTVMEIGRKAHRVFQKVIEAREDPLEIAASLEDEDEDTGEALRRICLSQFRHFWREVHAFHRHLGP